MRKFVHSGALGDIIYSFPIIRHFGGGELLSKRRHALYFSRLCKAVGYIKTDFFLDYKIYARPGNKHLTNLWGHPAVFVTPSHGEIYNLDNYRTSSRMHFERYLPQSHADIFGIDVDFTKPWIENITPKKIAPIIVHRTDRHIDVNKILDWKLLKDYKDKVLQIGFDYEALAFEKQFGFGFKYYSCEDPFEIAEVIAGCNLFIGNQSLCFAIAEGMKHKRILEVYHTRPNCGPIGDRGYTSITNDLIEESLIWEDNQMLDIDSKQEGRGLWRWLVVKDLYRVRKWRHDYFTHVFDIGANVGFFSLVIGFLQPFAKIFAIEPGPNQIKHLKENTQFLNIEIFEKAVGDGSDTCYFEDIKKSGASFCHETLGSLKVKTIKFSDVFKASGCQLSDRYLIKIDCEGGEKFLFFHDPESKEILKNASQINMEVHFDSRKTGGKGWLPWVDYNNWINENLSDTHDIQYYKSDKDKGWGHYCIVKKGVSFV